MYTRPLNKHYPPRMIASPSFLEDSILTELSTLCVENSGKFKTKKYLFPDAEGVGFFDFEWQSFENSAVLDGLIIPLMVSFIQSHNWDIKGLKLSHDIRILKVRSINLILNRIEWLNLMNVEKMLMFNAVVPLSFGESSSQPSLRVYKTISSNSIFRRTSVSRVYELVDNTLCLLPGENQISIEVDDNIEKMLLFASLNYM